MTIAPGLRAEVRLVVTGDDTAESVGSGDVPVLGTPRLLALAERATVEAVAASLEPGATSVGTRVELDHLAATPVGREIVVTAELVEADGRRLAFAVTARDGDTLAATGRVERAVVDRERFLARVTRA
ncbi:thioesterase family protein [Bailinhaonella thermotolerans]|uniref:Thioesterase n=1 Tax=Bailinhaonella thermotolerans TaxID=1070861 RepID=A0A3A4A9A0_9ACTN|nr:hotdog domain-containing protein [Bailinhaonella thermotolerans]RJL25185.1 thioesterase [Bailinhaonella thermotolerans]